MTMNASAMVEIEHLGKYFGAEKAVNDISLSVDEGEFVTLLGPSGCGKTTTLRCVVGLERPNTGEIRIGGDTVASAERDIYLYPEHRNIGMVFQSYAVWPHMTVFDNVAYGLRVRRASSSVLQSKTKRALELVGLDHLADRYATKLSGGQRQRVALARSIVYEPRVVLFDEPLSNLDAKLRRKVREDIRDLQRSLNLTVAYVTHDQQEALAVSDRIIVMSNAAIAQTGVPRDLYEAPADLFVADFIGDANLVKAELGRSAGERAPVRIGEATVELPHRGVAPGEVTVAIRPESLLISAERPNHPAIAGAIAKAAYLGTHMEYTIATALGDLFVVDRAVTRPLSPGAQIWLRLGDHGVTVVPPTN